MISLGERHCHDDQDVRVDDAGPAAFAAARVEPARL